MLDAGLSRSTLCLISLSIIFWLINYIIPGRSPGHTTALSIIIIPIIIINKKLLAEQTKFVLSYLPFVCGQYNYSVYSTVSWNHPNSLNLLCRSIPQHLYWKKNIFRLSPGANSVFTYYYSLLHLNKLFRTW